MSTELPKIDRPTQCRIQQIAAEWGFSVSNAKADLFARMIAQSLSQIELPEDDQRQRIDLSDRDGGRAPKSSENPHAAWSWITSIKGRDGPLTGKTLAIKDAIAVAGVPMRIGSRMTRGFVPSEDASVVKRALDNGALIRGKAQCEDMCQSPQSYTAWPNNVRNPHNQDRSAGGSSSGCAALVASGAVDLAIGGDSGGSIRVPSAYCGVVGMKPTFGLVPWTGTASLEMTLEHLGPITRSVRDNALLLEAIAGADGKDPRQSDVQTASYSRSTMLGIGGMRIGIIAEGINRPGIDPRVADGFMRSAKMLQTQGADLTTKSCPSLVWGSKVHTMIYFIGMSRLFRSKGLGDNWRGHYPEDLIAAMPDWMSRGEAAHDILVFSLIAGSFLDQESYGLYYARAQNLRNRVASDFDQALRDCDALILPTTLTIAPLCPEQNAPLNETLPSSLSAESNAPVFNVTGHPAINVPGEFVDSMPTGVMIVGRHFDESSVYRVAAAIEANQIA